MSTNKLTPFTYAKIPTELGRKRNLFHARNCEKLAAIMASLPRQRHDQDTFFLVDIQNECGTAGSALGWAAMSGKFPGLQYGLTRDSDGAPNGYAFPVINGQRGLWANAGEAFFGKEAHYIIFCNRDISRSFIIKLLKEEAKRLRSLRS